MRKVALLVLIAILGAITMVALVRGWPPFLFLPLIIPLWWRGFRNA